jgi:Leucine-rich repeat (LRR) protein
LWKPDLVPYESDVLLGETLKPNAQGEYSVNGKSYIRQDGKVYEKHFDSQIKKWRLRHPTDLDAYQPILHHNGLGAWRHSLEQPLEWDRPMLLRRMGHVTEPFTDEVLAHIADVSGVSDDALRAMHIDHQPPPPLLAETLNQFKIHQEVNTLVDQVRTGKGIADNRADIVLPVLVDMPRWPFGRVIEVFEGPGLVGKSTRYGYAPTRAKPTIKVTAEQVSSGQLPGSVLAALDEREVSQLLGGEGARGRSEWVTEFSKQMADHLNSQKTSMFTQIERGTGAVEADLKVLQRANPGMPDSIARQLLTEASELERLSLNKRQRVPLAMAEKARGLMQQARLNRAFAGLSLDSLASLDSDRVALHALEHLPGWQGKVRLEIREGSVEGRLVDSIGSDMAPERKYLVIRDNQFQAYDAEGNTLNGVSGQGRNYFSSILHALPDGVRSDLAMPSVGQGADLQKAVTEYAIGHRSEMSRALKQQPPRRGFRGPEPGVAAYGLSGRGAGAQVGYNASLVARVRDIYPNLTEEMAGRFVSDQMLCGRSDQQIFTLLNNRSRELEALTATLDGWVEPQAGPSLSIDRLNRRVVADRLIHCWRLGLHRDGNANVNLDLSGASDLPVLAADFSHVKEIKLNSALCASPAAGELLSQFPKLRSVRVTITEGAQLPASVTAATGLRELHLEGWELSHSAELQAQLNAMPQLQTLSIRGKMEGLDLNRLSQLRQLDLSYCQLQQWPAGILELDHLQSLNLSGNPISRLPQALLSGHEPLWRGLVMDWSKLEHASFMSAYRHVLDNPAHLADAEQMANHYRGGCLRSRVPVSEQARFQLPSREEGVTTATLLEQIGEMRREEDQFVRQLDDWKAQSIRVERMGYDGDHRQVVADRLLASWRYGVQARWGGETQGHATAPVLDLSGGLLADLPDLPSAAYTHVQTLNLQRTFLAQGEVDRLLARLPQLQNLDLRYNRLYELPTAVDQLTRLRVLDLSHNDLTITPAIQGRLSRLTSLEVLNLQFNRVGALDVSGMTALKSLDLSSTAVTQWPNGVLDLPNLRSVNFNNSGITSFPQPITIANEHLLAMAQVRGCRLTDQAIAEQLDVANRLRARLGLPPMPAPAVADRSHLQMMLEPAQPLFYPDLDAIRAECVLPDLPAEVVPGEPALTAHERLRRLDPDMDQGMAHKVIEGLEDEGLSPTQIDARITQWRQAYVTMRDTLNTWIESRVFGEAGRNVSQRSRRRAADSILWCWRREVLVGPVERAPGGGAILDLTDLGLGDLPALAQPLASVHTLRLGGAGLSEQGSNGFLNSFPRLRNLVLDQNRLESLPDAVTGMRDLSCLQLRYNELSMTETLQRQLNSLSALRELDLGNNRLLAFDVSVMPRLEVLNLEGNNLAEWPTGVLQVPGLRTLNLSRNRLTTIPEALWDLQSGPPRGPYVNAVLRHERLISGMDISDNPLSHEDVLAILDCSREHGHRLGYSQDDLEGSASDEGSMSGEEEASADESLGQANDCEEEQLARWLTDDVANNATRRAIWQRLKAQESNEAFFHLLSELRESADFARTRADLTDRVWQVLEAADRNDSLRELLFGASRSGYTCGDGRILLFSDLEVQVLVFNTEQSVGTGQQGAALLGLAKRLFRLDKVKAIADARVKANPGTDPAEIRLAYRKGLANRLQLPNQPRDMLYEGIANISSTDLDAAFSQVTAAEQTDELVSSLAERTFWSDYLKKTYPQRFADFQRQHEVEYDRVEELHPNFDDARELAMQAWSIDKNVAEQALKIELTGLERTELGL